MQNLVVIKVGGKALGNSDTSTRDIGHLYSMENPLLIVHGGGNIISEWMALLGKRPRFVKGLRVTDSDVIDIVTATLAGLLNKKIVSELNSLNTKVLGLSGVDSKILECELIDEVLGYVGKVVNINVDLLATLLKLRIIPVIAPIGYLLSKETKQESHILNVNADEAAGALATKLEAKKLIFLTDVEGVLDASGRLIRKLSREQAQNMIETGVARGGMLPKLQACLEALKKNVEIHIVDGRKPHAILNCMSDNPPGTFIK